MLHFYQEKNNFYIFETCTHKYTHECQIVRVLVMNWIVYPNLFCLFEQMKGKMFKASILKTHNAVNIRVSILKVAYSTKSSIMRRPKTCFFSVTLL